MACAKAALLRHILLVGMVALVLTIVLLSDRQARVAGDRLQVALPLAGLACAIATGDGVRYTGRYLLLEAGIKGPKYALGDAPLNRRPNGGTRGFPSGHTAAASFGATALVTGCLSASPGAQAVAVMSAGFVGGSRIDAEKHTIWQTLAGALLGYGVIALRLGGFDRAFARLWKGTGRRIAREARRMRGRRRRWARLAALATATALSVAGARAEVGYMDFAGDMAAPRTTAGAHRPGVEQGDRRQGPAGQDAGPWCPGGGGGLRPGAQSGQ